MTLHKDYTKSEDGEPDLIEDLIWLGIVLLSTWWGISLNEKLWFFFGPILAIFGTLHIIIIIQKLRKRQN